ncbi:MAG: recombinase family protein [Clostridia bacterium]
MEKTITRLEPTTPRIPRKTKVAAYARVSSGKEAMIHSLSAQVSHYSDTIQHHPGWSYVGVYADEGISGAKDDRDEFQRMLTDCRAGKIDLILTKAISRFARNTVTLLETVRELRLLGVDIFFERENIHSISGDGELLLTILASFAQEESRSTSENCKWRIRSDFKQGKPGNLRIYGYRQKKGVLVVEPKEAEIVQMIFHDYLSGMGRNLIMKKLRGMGAKTLQGAQFKEAQILAMLHNEKYVGDLLLQKTFVASHPNEWWKKNKGELPKYLVRNAHEAIIDRETFDKVQAELKRRTEERAPAPKGREAYPFTGIMTCGHCGKHFRRKTVISPGYAPKVVWICATFNTLGKKACPAKQIPETILMETVASALELSAFDERIFAERVKEIRVPAANRLVFVLKDGQEIEREWQDHSRRDSWDEVGRQRASECARRRYDK